MSSLYELVPVKEGVKFINFIGDQYTVYITEYFLKNPNNNTEHEYVNTFMFGFNCKRADITKPNRFDAKTKATILNVFKKFADSHPNDAFMYLCDDSDGLARNRRITFGTWFTEANIDHERVQSDIKYNGSNWYSRIIIKSNNPDKQLLLDAYNFTLKQMM